MIIYIIKNINISNNVKVSMDLVKQDGKKLRNDKIYQNNSDEINKKIHCNIQEK